MMDSTVERLVYVLAVWLAISGAYFIRRQVKSGDSVAYQVVNWVTLFTVCVGVVPLAKITSLHLLWMFPATCIVGMASHIFPLSLVVLLGHPFGKLCCLELDRKTIRERRAILGIARTVDCRRVLGESAYTDEGQRNT